MRISPELSAFAEAYDRGQAQALVTRHLADLETPVSVYLKLAEHRANAFLLESVQGGETRGRYSIIGLAPDLIWRCRGGSAEINRDALNHPDLFSPDVLSDKPLISLRALHRETMMTLPQGVPPMAVGLFGYLGYDMVRVIEKLKNPPPDTLGLPDAILIRPTLTAIFDNVRDEITIVTPVYPDKDIPAKTAFSRASARLHGALADLAKPIQAMPAPERPSPAPAHVESNMTHAEYLDIVARAKDYIRAGDIFQVVPSQRFRRPFALPSIALYRALRRLNPSPFLYHLAFPGFAIVGSSPEILVRLRNGVVTIRPIAGTRPRGADEITDKALEEELISDPKERAEHLMLLDLGRNDVGRVAETGSVEVTDQFFIERYSHVMHLVSNVDGKIRAGLDAIDALAAGLPAGTLSGAPKIRAMEIIDEFEKEKRGAAYAGAVGYFAADGSLDTCIVLRTALVKDGTLYVQAGGGVVADSDPEAEFQETVNKSRAILAAADEAVRYSGMNSEG